MPTKHQISKINNTCNFAYTVGILGDVWCMLILINLIEDEKRFGELLELINGISKSVLSQRLKHLQAHNIISLRKEKSTPPASWYKLSISTKKVQDLCNAYKEIGSLILNK